MGLGKVLGIIGLAVGLMLSLATLIMNQICDINSKSIPNQEWLEISNDLCQMFNSLTELITKIIS